MRSLDENQCSKLIQNLISDCRKLIYPKKLKIYVQEPLWNVVAQNVQDEEGNFNVFVPENSLNDYIISHELLHILSKYHGMPRMVRTLDEGIIAFIGAELQGYLEHNWILSEQKRLGLQIDEYEQYRSFIENLEEETNTQINVKRIAVLNNIIRTYPELFQEFRDYFKRKIPKTLQLSERIMSHYPDKDILTYFESKRATVKAIKEWQKIFIENNINVGNMSLLISVTPVFSNAQMNRLAKATVKFLPNIINNTNTKEQLHVLLTIADGQACTFFKSPDVERIKNTVNNKTLEEFIKIMGNLPYLMR